jgi:tRNA pseudouridine55 synthase
MPPHAIPKGILLINKPKGKTSFSLVAALRRKLHVQKIGHAGTLDPFATGVMVLLIGKEYTRLSDRFLGQDKEYSATIHLGIQTDSYDCDGQTLATSDKQPDLAAIEQALTHFQGTIEQVPPMFSAKKVQGKRLYELARKGKTVERQPVKVTVQTKLISYHYPFLKIDVVCSKGTYIRSLAHDLGLMLGCGGHLCELERTRSGPFTIEECIDGTAVCRCELDVIPYLKSYEGIQNP